MIALVPGVRALLPRYASLEDPVAELRAACHEAVRALGPSVRIAAGDPGSVEVASALVTAVGSAVAETAATGLLVVGNGSAMRTEKAPGFLDPRAEEFDLALRAGLMAGDPRPDAALAAELWADVAALDELRGAGVPRVLYDDAPFGVQYWVMLWA